MEFLIGLIAVVLIFSIYKFMSKVKAKPTALENTHKHPVEPTPSKDISELPGIDSI